MGELKKKRQNSKRKNFFIYRQIFLTWTVTMDQSPDPNKVKKIREKIWSETGRPELICSIPLDFKMSKSAPASPKRKDKSLFFGHPTSKTSDKKKNKGHDQDEAYHSDSNDTSPPAPHAGAVYKIPKYKGKGKGKGKSSQ